MPLPDAALAFALALVLLLQFRLLDDVSDVSHDRIVHPERVLPRAASLVPFFVLLCICILANAALVAAQPGPPHRLILLLAMNAGAFLWHFILRDRVNGPILRYHVAIVKYPLFVFLLRGDSWNNWHLLLSMAAVYLSFSLYEVLHDRDLQALRRAETVLRAEIGALFAVAALMTLEVTGNRPAFAFLQGIIGLSGFAILSDLFLRRRVHLGSARSGYAVLILVFILVVNFSMGVRQ